jgi:hypothetical protein
LLKGRAENSTEEDSQTPNKSGDMHNPDEMILHIQFNTEDGNHMVSLVEIYKTLLVNINMVWGRGEGRKGQNFQKNFYTKKVYFSIIFYLKIKMLYFFCLLPCTFLLYLFSVL